MDKWEQVKPTYGKLIRTKEFSLLLPCVVIDLEGNVHETNLSALSSHLRISSAISHPLMKQFVELAEQIGAEAAMNEMLQRDDAEEFAMIYDESKQDVERGTLGTADDVARVIKVAQEGFESNPKKLIVIQQGEERGEVLLVGEAQE